VTIFRVLLCVLCETQPITKEQTMDKDAPRETYRRTEADKKALKKSLLEIVEKQILENNPPETRETLDRLMKDGYTEHEAKIKIAMVVTKEMFVAITDKASINTERFIEGLNKLGTMDFANFSDEEMIDLLFSEGDRLPREAVDEMVRRGERMIEPLAHIIGDESVWKEADDSMWAVLHAVHILGAMGGEKVVKPLLKALFLSATHQDDSIMDILPAIIGCFPVAALAELKEIAARKEVDGNVRTMVIEGMVEMALCHRELADDVFAFIGDLFLHDESADVQEFSGLMLMDNQRAKYKDALLAFVRKHKDDPFLMYDEEEVIRSFSAPMPDSALRRSFDLLSFYNPEQVAARKQLRECGDRDDNDYEFEDDFPGMVLDRGMCVCADCGEVMPMGGFLPPEEIGNDEPVVVCRDCFAEFAAMKEEVNADKKNYAKASETNHIMLDVLTERYLREADKDAYDSEGEVNEVAGLAFHAWNSLPFLEKERVTCMEKTEKQEYFKSLAIDFSRAIRRYKYAQGSKIGRNDPCPCGSGKKFKKCCGK
jgi:hypothetical protein